MACHAAVILLFIESTLLAGTAPEPASFAVVGDWDVRVTAPGQKTRTLHVDSPSLITVNAERYDSIPVFSPKAAGWLKGVQVKGVKAHETTSPNLIDPSSFSLRAGPDPDAASSLRELTTMSISSGEPSDAWTAARSSQGKRFSPPTVMRSCAWMR